MTKIYKIDCGEKYMKLVVMTISNSLKEIDRRRFEPLSVTLTPTHPHPHPRCQVLYFTGSEQGQILLYHIKPPSHQTSSYNVLPRPEIIGKRVTVGVECVTLAR